MSEAEHAQVAKLSNELDVLKTKGEAGLQKLDSFMRDFQEQYRRSLARSQEEIEGLFDRMQGALKRMGSTFEIPKKFDRPHLEELAIRRGWLNPELMASMKAVAKTQSVPEQQAGRAARRAFLDWVTANTVAQTPQRELGLKLYGMMNRAGMTTVPKEYEDYVLGRKRVDWSTIGRLEEHMPGPVVGPRTLRPSEQRIDFIQRGGLTHPERLDMRDYPNLDFSTAGLGAAPVERSPVSRSATGDVRFDARDYLRASAGADRGPMGPAGNPRAPDLPRVATGMSTRLEGSTAWSAAVKEGQEAAALRSLRQGQWVAAEQEAQGKEVDRAYRAVFAKLEDPVVMEFPYNRLATRRTNPELLPIIGAVQDAHLQAARYLEQVRRTTKDPKAFQLAEARIDAVKEQQRGLLALWEMKNVNVTDYNQQIADIRLAPGMQSNFLIALARNRKNDMLVAAGARRVQRSGGWNQAIAFLSRLFSRKQPATLNNTVDKALATAPVQQTAAQQKTITTEPGHVPHWGEADLAAAKDRLVFSGTNVFAKEPDITPPINPPARPRDVDPPPPTAPAPDVQVQ